MTVSKKFSIIFLSIWTLLVLTCNGLALRFMVPNLMDSQNIDAGSKYEACLNEAKGGYYALVGEGHTMENIYEDLSLELFNYLSVLNPVEIEEIGKYEQTSFVIYYGEYGSSEDLQKKYSLIIDPANCLIFTQFYYASYLGLNIGHLDPDTSYYSRVYSFPRSESVTLVGNVLSLVNG